MIIWRLHASRYDSLDPTGAKLYGGRWNVPGQAVVYGSKTFEGGLIEVLAHQSAPRNVPKGFVGTELSVPDSAGFTVIDDNLPEGWDDLDDLTVAQRLARPWFDTGKDLVLDAPSVPTFPIGRTLVLNATHPRFDEVAVLRTVPVTFDRRL